MTQLEPSSVSSPKDYIGTAHMGVSQPTASQVTTHELVASLAAAFDIGADDLVVGRTHAFPLLA